MRVKRVVQCVALGLVSMIVFGCASNTLLRTGRPLGKGKVEGVVAVSRLGPMHAPGVNVEGAPDFTFFEIGAAVGVLERLDIGLKYTFPTAGSIDAKYCLLGNGDKGFFLSPGLKAGYTSFPSSDTSKENNRVEFAVPLYLSYFPVDWAGISIIPTYSGRFFNTGDSYLENLVGCVANVRLGRKVGVLIEGAYFKNLRQKWTEVQYGAGLVMNLGSGFGYRPPSEK